MGQITVFSGPERRRRWSVTGPHCVVRIGC